MRRPNLVLLLAVLSAQANAQDSPDALARDFIARKSVPGVAYVVLIQGAIVARGAYGVADVATKAKVTIDSVFPIASLSKPFVAMGVLSLAEAGRVDLKAPIGQYLPDLPESWRGIPIVRLLDHTSGVPDHLNEGHLYDGKAITSDDLVKKLTALPLNFQAGDQFRYSNGNYVLLAKLIERVSGKPYDAFLQEKIFTRLEMKRTKALTTEDMASVVQGYANGPSGIVPTSFNLDWCYGNGALGSSIVDLSRLDAGLYTERVLRFSTMSFLTHPQPLNSGKLAQYAMGWFTGMQRGARCIDHSGRVGGWASYFVRYPESVPR